MFMLCLRRAFVACFVALCLSTLAHAGDEWQPIDPADLKATSYTQAPGADAVILYREETFNDMHNFQQYYVRVKILTEKGQQEWSKVEVPYLKGRRTSVAGIKARTIHPDGTIIPFDGQSVDKLVVRGHGTKVFVRAFALPQVEVGSIIEYKYEMRWDDTELPGADWEVQTDEYQRKAIFRYYPYNFKLQSVIVTNNHGEILDNINYTPFLPASFPKIERKPTVDGVVMTLAVDDVPALKKEPYMVPADQIAYRVHFYYVYGETANEGMDDFWKEQAKFWNRSADKFMGHDKSAAAMLADIVAPADTAEQKAKKIYAAIQKFQNLSYGRSHTVEENKFDKLPTSVDDVLEQKRGFASDLTRSYVALARAAGLHAYLARVASRDRWIFQKAVLDDNQFDSEAAIVEIDGKEVYLDPGTKFCPYGMLAWQKTFVTAQRQTASGKIEFVSTPGTSYKDTVTKHIADMKLSEDGSITGKVTLGFFGQEGLRHRQAVLEVDDQQRKKDLEDEVAGLLPLGTKVSLEHIWNQDDIDKPLIARFDVDVVHFATATNKRLLVPAALFGEQETHAFTDKDREQAVYFEYPYEVVDELTVHLPDDVKIGELPKETKEQKDFCAYAMAPSSGNEFIKFHRELLMGDFLIPVKSYPELKGFYEGVRNGDEQQAILEFAGKTQAQSAGGK